MLYLLACAGGAAQSTIQLARIEGIPDQAVGGEILRAVYRRLDIDLRFADVPAKRALALSSSGVLDGEVQRIANLNQQYPTLIQISPPINYIEPAVFVTGLSFTVDGWPSIKDYEIGIVRGVGSSEAGTAGMRSVHAAKDLSSLMLMLDAGHIDLAVTDLLSGLVQVKEMKLDARVHPLSPPIERIYIYHYLHEKHRELATRVAAVIREMQETGELSRIRQELFERILATGSLGVAAAPD